MLIDYDSHPKKSLLYNASMILNFLMKRKTVDLDEMNDFCKKNEIEYPQMIYSLDWLYLIGRINDIDGQGRIIL